MIVQVLRVAADECLERYYDVLVLVESKDYDDEFRAGSINHGWREMIRMPWENVSDRRRLV